MVRMQVQFTEPQIEALRQLSALQERSISDVVRESVNRMLAEQSRAAVVERAISAIGKYRSGHSDISVNHDAYLDEA